ncbi:MAG: plasmid pRiA4b ORF-3 family protein [Promethearchaeota archaeon]
MGKQNPKHKKKHIQRKNSLSSTENIKQSSFSELEPSFNEEISRFNEILKDYLDAFRFPTPRENYNSNSLPNFNSNAVKKIFQLKISIKYIRPPIWRRILIEDTATFSDLHNAIQGFFDWDNYHLHEFESRLKDPIKTVIRIGCDDNGAYDILNEENVELRQILSMENKRIHYLYDFGDNWEHLIVLEKIYDYSDFFDNDFPICIKGKRAAPPEDCGGVYGYGNILDALKSPKDPDNEGILEWVGDFNPDEINCEIIPINEIIVNEKKLIDKTSGKIPLNESSVQKDLEIGGISSKLLEIKDINSKSGESITQIIDKFLETQEKRLKESTFKKYKKNMESWKEVLNEDGKVILNEDLNVSVNPLKFKDTRKKFFCTQYGENVLVPLIAIYLDHQYVCESNIDLGEFKEIATVFSKFIKWLNGEYIDNDQYIELNKQLTKFRSSIKIVENEGYNSENDEIILAFFQK